MADLLKPGFAERDIDQAIIALKKGAYLLKYGRRGKPKFCPFRLSSDESTLIWYYGKDEKQLDLRHVSRIIPGQRTRDIIGELLPSKRGMKFLSLDCGNCFTQAVFQRYPRPEKEYQSFSLVYSDRSLDLICKDKEEAEVWFVGLKALIAQGGSRRTRYEAKAESLSCDSPHGRRNSPSNSCFDPDTPRLENLVQSRLGKAFADIVSHTATPKSPLLAETVSSSGSPSSGATENLNARCSAADTIRVSLSSAVSSSSQGSGRDDFDSFGDIFIWGEGTGKGVLGGGEYRVGQSCSIKINANTPKTVESTMVLDVQSIACGDKHAILVTKQGEVFSWGEETGGRLGHGVETDLSHPKLIDILSGVDIKMVACGDYHSCAVTLSGDLYTWGDGSHNSGLLGHGSEVSHWIPKKVSGLFEGLQVSYISCGPWHMALITSAGQLFSFGDGTFGALGHGDRSSTNVPREVEALKGFCTLKVACGVWHTAAVVEATSDASDSGPSDGSLSGKLFTWGDGEKGQLGHGDNKPRLVPQCVAASHDVNFSQVACGHNLTVALTTSGRVYTTGSTVHGQLGNPVADGKTLIPVEGNIADRFIEHISCGSHHVAVSTSKMEVYTWGKGSEGQLGLGDNDDRSTPFLVEFLKNKQVKSVVCGSNFTAAICIHKGLSSADNSVCSGCQNPFNFRRKRHNCYNCGLVFCKACSSMKSTKASLAPTPNKPYRVCDDCFTKLEKSVESESASRIPKVRSGPGLYKTFDVAEKEMGGPQLLGNISRLSSSGSFNLDERQSTRSNMILQSNESRSSFPPNGNIQTSSVFSCKSANGPKRTYMKFLSISGPTSRMVSRSTSPVKPKTSPLHPVTHKSSTDAHKEEPAGGPEHSNEGLNEEIKYLKAQVEELASKSQLLEAELERQSWQLKEATAKAVEEAEKTKAAKEVIKSLTLQLKEMSEGHIANSLLIPNAEQIRNDPNRTSEGSSVITRTASSKSETSESSVNPVFSNGTKTEVQKSERVIQDEPGVYITLVPLPGGGNELRRVRFSRRRFTEEQAEAWWSENVTKVYQRHNIRS